MTGRVVLITGAAKRIGASIAKFMAEDGWNVAIHYNSSKDEAEKTADIVRGSGREAVIIKADLCDTAELSKVFSTINKSLGQVSCLINNASLFQNDNISDVDGESLREHMETNLYAPVLLSQAFAKQYGGDKGGNIINMVDYCVLNLPDKFLSYVVSKSALWTVTQMTAVQLAPNIRVNAIAPGHSLKNKREMDESFEDVRKLTPLQNSADPKELYNAVKFILSSPSMTGQILAMDGGKHLVGADFY